MIQAIVLAAGSSRRFGENKLNKEFLGKPVLHHVLDTVIKAGLEHPIVVYHNKDILENKPYSNQLTYVYNKDALQGMSTSIRCGLLHAPKTDAYMFINGDQPLITVQLLERLTGAYRKGLGSIIVPRYQGKRGNPTIFSIKWREGLLQITGDKGGRDFIKNYPEEVYYVDIEDIYMGMDIDTQEDYKILKELKDHER